MPQASIAGLRASIRSKSRSEERFSRNAETDLVCRLLLEKKNQAASARVEPGSRSRQPCEDPLHFFFLKDPAPTEIYTLSLHDALPIYTKRQNLFQELDAVIHLLMEAKHWGLRKSRNATSLNSRFKSLDTLKVKIISVTFRRVIRTNHKKASKIWRHENIQLGGCQS